MEFLGKKLRHELKYYIHPYEYVTLRQRLAAMLQLDGNSDDKEGYGIRSLYFDGPQNHSLYDKVNGIFGRQKFRIRIYNGEDRTIKLERKSKYGDYVCKEAVQISREEYDRILNRDISFLLAYNHLLIKDFYKALQGGYKPAAIVDYVREAYVYELGDVRITFDKMLSAGVNSHDLFDPHLALTEALDSTRTIMEIKYNDFLPEAIRLIVMPDAHNRSSISKYVICRELGYRHFRP
jgi:hypothetical protein